MFNNVNDFPTWATATSPQDAVYIELWPPHVGLEHLAQVATRASREAGGKPVVIAAYQHVYASTESARADLASGFTMATLRSHGATHLLCGEADRTLVDPHYVRNHQVCADTAAMLRRWYDFSVEHAELLTTLQNTTGHTASVGASEVTGSYAGPYNDDLDVTYPGAGVEVTPRPGTVRRRITSVGDQLVLHLINLCGQDDTLWDSPRNEPADPGPGTLRMRRAGPDLPRVRYADPDRRARLIDVEVHADGDHATAQLPAPHLWQLVLVDPWPTEPAPTGPSLVQPRSASW